MARQKLKAKRGFSLAETLVAVLILGLLSSAAALGVSQALWQRNKSIALADAQTVASTAAQMVTDQLRYGQVAQGESGGETIMLRVDQSVARISLNAEGHLFVQPLKRNDDGDWVDGGSGYKPLEEKAYCDLHLSQLKFELHENGGQVESVDVTVGVAQSDETELWSLDVSVSPVNPQRFELS